MANQTDRNMAMPVRSVFSRSVLAIQIRPVSIRMIKITTTSPNPPLGP